MSAFDRQNIPPSSAQLSSVQAAQLSSGQPSSGQFGAVQLHPAPPSSPQYSYLISKNQKSTQSPGNDHSTYEPVCWPSRLPSEHISAVLSVLKSIHDNSAQLCSAQPSTAQLSTAQLSSAQRNSAQVIAVRLFCVPSQLSDFLPAKILQIVTRSTMAEPRSACY